MDMGDPRPPAFSSCSYIVLRHGATARPGQLPWGISSGGVEVRCKYDEDGSIHMAQKRVPAYACRIAEAAVTRSQAHLRRVAPFPEHERKDMRE